LFSHESQSWHYEQNAQDFCFQKLTDLPFFKLIDLPFFLKQLEMAVFSLARITRLALAAECARFYRSLGLFGLGVLKFNFHHINVLSKAWSTKYRLIVCMWAHIRSNLRDESNKPN
jgi:hypothetical protein